VSCKSSTSYEKKLAVIQRHRQGSTWREALEAEEVSATIRTAQRWAQLEREQAGNAQDRRRGSAWKVTAQIRHWLITRCQSKTDLKTIDLSQELEKTWHVQVSISHLNRIRAKEDLSYIPQKKPNPPERNGVKELEAFS